MNRRVFMKSGAMALVTMGLSTAFLKRSVYAQELLKGAARYGNRRGKVLICLFQRGAADALNVVVPHGEAAYYRLRPSIAIPRPGPLREVAQLMLIAVSLALTGWYHRHRGTWPRGRAPEEIRRVKVTFLIGATVVVCLVAVAFGLAGPWVATPVAVVVMAPALAWYERAYANAAARARARLG